MELIRYFTPEQYAQALDSWMWHAIGDMRPMLANLLGDVFLHDEKGVHFLDVISGELTLLCADMEALEKLLNTPQGQERYLWSDVVMAADAKGMKLAENEIYDFAHSLSLGGQFELENLRVMDFAVAVNIAGQVHRQIKDIPDGQPVNVGDIKIVGYD